MTMSPPNKPLNPFAHEYNPISPGVTPHPHAPSPFPFLPPPPSDPFSTNTPPFHLLPPPPPPQYFSSTQIFIAYSTPNNYNPNNYVINPHNQPAETNPPPPPPSPAAVSTGQGRGSRAAGIRGRDDQRHRLGFHNKYLNNNHETTTTRTNFNYNYDKDETTMRTNYNYNEKIEITSTKLINDHKIKNNKFCSSSSSSSCCSRRRRNCMQKKDDVEMLQVLALKRDHHDDDEEKNTITTTVMIKNIPYDFPRNELVSFLDHFCSIENSKAKNEGTSREGALICAYNFLYLPIDFWTKNSRGFAFVNFTNARAVWKFFDAFHLKKWDFMEWNKWPKRIEIVCAKIQGKEALVEHFSESIFECETDEYLPVCFNPPRDGSGQSVKLTVIGNRRAVSRRATR